MSAQQFDEYELGAMLEAGRNAGSYLDEIGKTDLKLLDRDEWREFLFRLLTGYEQALRRKITQQRAATRSAAALRGCPWELSKLTPKP